MQKEILGRIYQEVSEMCVFMEKMMYEWKIEPDEVFGDNRDSFFPYQKAVLQGLSYRIQRARDLYQDVEKIIEKRKK